MTLHARVARMDDYTEELTRSLEKLEMEKSRGVINKDEQLDFILELRKAVEAKDVKPWRSRGTAACVIGLVLLGGSFFLPAMVPHRHAILLLACLLASASIAFAIYAFGVSMKRPRPEMQWLDQLEAAVNRGGTIFDQV